MKSEGYWILGNPTISAVTNNCTDWGLSENSSHVYHITMIFVALLLRWVEIKLVLVMDEYQDLQTHLNLISDLTGNLSKMLCTMSSGTRT